MYRPKHTKLWAAVALLWVTTVGLQISIQPDRQKIAPAATTEGLGGVGRQSKELLGGVLLGFREVAAGLLWVRADEYFHNGRYMDLVPLFYIVTWLDPHQLDVYSTGAWHLAYNLGDQRLIPEGVKFLEKGIRDNSKIYDLYFQQAYLHFNKVRDYAAAVRYAREATQHPGTDGEPAPYYIDNHVAHALESNGQIPEMLRQWDRNIAKTKNRIVEELRSNAKYRRQLGDAKIAMIESDTGINFLADPQIQSIMTGDPELSMLKASIEVQTKNRDTNILRRDYFRKGAGEPGYKFDWNAKPYPRWVYVGGAERHRQNTNFDYKVTKVGPRKLKITGHIEGVDFHSKDLKNRPYSRLTVLFRDKNYASRYAAHAQDLQWQQENLTYYWNKVAFPTAPTAQLKPGQESTEFEILLDFSKGDPDLGLTPTALYPFKADEYELTVMFNPTDQDSPFHLDVFGWKGEGLTDDRYLTVDERGIRVIKKTVTLKRSEVI